MKSLQTVSHSLMMQTVIEFQNFCRRLNIGMNVSKTFYMNGDGIDYEVEVDGVPVQHTNGCNLLGIELDNQLDIGPQIKEVIKKVRSLRYLLRTFGKLYKTENAQTIFANAYVVGSFNHGSQYMPEWTLDQYIALQSQINKSLNYRTSRILQFINNSGNWTDELERNATVRAIQRLRQQQQNYPWMKEITIPQWLLLRRHKMTSIQNIHRTNWMTRMVRLLRTARPEIEYQDLMKYLTESAKLIRRNIRLGTRFPYFRATLMMDKHAKDKPLLNKTTPTIWLREFSQIPQEMRMIMMTDKCAVTHVQTHYKERCQHAEDTNETCEGCNQIRSNYRKGRVKFMLKSAQEIAENRNDILRKSIMIWDGQQWQNVHEAEEGVDNQDDVICIFWNDPHQRMQTLRQMGLMRNTELERLINRIHGTE